ncbi:MAG TPA: hypothetical protein VFJ16_16945 [Longimicrobium sp.]|nr:hypothetical protein [Longimicrobium sp.]
MSTTENAAPEGIQIAAADVALQNLGVRAPLTGAMQRVQDATGVSSTLSLSTSKVQLGTATEPAAFQVQVPWNDPSGPSFIIGDTGRSNLRMGVEREFSWVQSHGGKPLQVNPIGNNVVISRDRTARVGIGTEKPQALLDVNGDLRATSLTVGGSAAVSGALSVAGALSVGTLAVAGALTVHGPGFKISGIPSADSAPDHGAKLKHVYVDPDTGSLYMR